MWVRRTMGLIALVLCATSAQAVVIPFGVQNNVSIATVTGAWGWTQCYSSVYKDPFGSSAATQLSGCTGNYIMLAGATATNDPTTGDLIVGDTLLVLAAALKTDVLTDTGMNLSNSHLANGVEWYNTNQSVTGDAGAIGFAKGGDSVLKGSCDVLTTNSDQRLCWHTSSTFGGWRVGSEQGLNLSEGYVRLAYDVTYTVGPLQVPEPATLLGLVLGLLGLGLARSRSAR